MATSKHTRPLSPRDPYDRRRRPGRLALRIADLERNSILEALVISKGHCGHAAEYLGVDPVYLWRARKRLGIAKPPTPSPE